MNFHESKTLKTQGLYDSRATLYDKLMVFLGYTRCLKRFLHSMDINMPETPSILDIGCGTGISTQILLKRYPSAKITGLDLSEEMLRMYYERFPDSRTIIGDFNCVESFHDYPDNNSVCLNDSSFDLVVSTGAVSEYAVLDETIPLIFRLLKTDGFFINFGVKDGLLGDISGLLWHFKPTGPVEFIDSCITHGFKDVELIPQSKVPFPSNITKYLLLLRK